MTRHVTTRLLALMLLVAITQQSARAQSTCLPADSNSSALLARLKMYATATAAPYTTVRDGASLPAISATQVNTQVVLVTTGSVCSLASGAFNRTSVQIDPSDNNPTRAVYLFKFATRYVIVGFRKGRLSGIEVWPSDFSTQISGLVEQS
jgi:hypothetical protein